jgi:hypothetical protein
MLNLRLLMLKESLIFRISAPINRRGRFQQATETDDIFKLSRNEIRVITDKDDVVVIRLETLSLILRGSCNSFLDAGTKSSQAQMSNLTQ